MLDQFTFTEPLHLGQVSITIEHEEFIDAMGYGLLSCFENDVYHKQQMSAQELFEEFQEMLCDDDTSLPWRLGFLVGEFAGLLHPELRDHNPMLTYLESLSRSCQQRYDSSAQCSK